MHPTHEELAGFVFGTLAEELADTVAEHVDQCPECEDTVRELETASDDVIRLLRRPVVEHPFEQESDCHRLVEVIEAIGRAPCIADVSARAVDRQSDLGAIRDYQLLAKLGQGGMGTVYKALHGKLKKIVALKVLPAERMQHAHAVARFELEMEAVGRLTHPNIVGAHDAGEQDGTHYLVMEYVDGIDLAEMVHRLGPLPIADACELVRQAAVGLQYAHEHNLVHRDIKPSNLMLEVQSQGASVQRRLEATQSQFSTVDTRLLAPALKILDLGLARLHNGDRVDLTSTGQMLGTVDYMAPEQTGDSHDVDIRADIYSLGATLFKLLCGRAPYADARYNTMLKRLKAMAVEPIPAIRDFRPDVPDGLVAVLEQMLAKDPADRFATPHEVAEALQPFAATADLAALIARYEGQPSDDSDVSTDGESSGTSTLEYLSRSMTETAAEKSGHHAPRDEPVVERSPDPTTRSDARPQRQDRLKPGLQRGHRNAKIIGLLLGLAALFAGAMVIRVATDKGEIRVTAYDPQIEVTVKRNDQPVDGFQVKQRVDGASYYSGDYEIEIVGGKPDGVEIKNEAFKLTRGKEVLVEIVLVAAAGKPAVDGVARSGDRPQQNGDRPQREQNPWPLGPDGGVLPGLAARPASLPGIGRWQVETRVARSNILCVDWSPDDTLLACGTATGEVRVYDTQTWDLVKLFLGHEGSVFSVAWHPDGKRLASVDAGHHQTLRVWSLADEPVQVFQGPRWSVTGVAWNRDGTQLAIGCSGGVRIWNLDGTLHKEWKSDGGTAGGASTGFAWSPDGQWLATEHLVDGQGIIRLWKPDGTPGPELTGHTDDVLTLAWSPDSQWLASGAADGTVRLWNHDGTEKIVLDAEASAYFNGVGWSPDSRQVVAHGDGSTVRIWSIDGKLESEKRHDLGFGYAVAWSREGSRIAATGTASIQIYGVGDTVDQQLRGIEDHQVQKLAWSPDGKVLATEIQPLCLWKADGERICVLDDFKTYACFEWIPESTQLLARRGRSFHVLSEDGAALRAFCDLDDTPSSVAWSPDGSRVAVRSHDDSQIRIFNAEGELEQTLVAHKTKPRYSYDLALSWHPDGKILASASSFANEILFWRVGDDEGPFLKLDVDQACNIAWSPDGEQLAAIGRSVKLFRPDGTLRTTLDHPGLSGHRGVAWRPDGRQLAVGHNADGVSIWSSDGELQQTLRVHQTGGITSLDWSPDGQQLASGGFNGTIWTWNPDTGEPLWTAMLLNGSDYVTFNGAGQILFGDPEVVEQQLVYLIETEPGVQEVLKPSEFTKRVKAAAAKGDE